MKSKILAMLFALVSVVAMGQEVIVDTVMTDSVMTDSVAADSVKADTYVKQEGMTVYAEIRDHFTHDPVKMRCVTLLMAADSALVDTVSTYFENEGDYKSSHLYKGFKEAGKYLFKLEADGYQTMYVPFELKKIYKRELYRELKPIYMRPLPKKNEMMLDEVVVKATKLKFYMDGDTLVYDADAFNLSEGSMLGELMKKLPGVEVEKGGVISVNGKQIDALLLNGKDFFDSDRELLLENMPSYMVKNVQAYERAPESVKGKPEEKTTKKELVMNVKLKKEYAKGWIANAEGGAGATFFRNDEGDFDTKFLGRLFGMRFTDRSRVVLFANANNLNDYRTPGEKGEWTPLQQSEGLRTIYKAGGNFRTEGKDDQYRYQGSFESSYSHTDNTSNSSSATFLEGGDTYGRSQSASRQYEWEVRTEHSLTLDRSEAWANLIKGLYLHFRPSLNYRKWNRRSQSASVTLSEDVAEQLGKAWLDSIMAPDASGLLKQYAINRTLSQNKDTGHWLNSSTSYYMNFRPAHNDYISFVVDGDYQFSESEGKSYDHYRLDYPKGQQETDFRNRYTPSLNRSHVATINSQANFWLDEKRRHCITPGYTFNYNYDKNNRSLYLLNQLEGWNDTETHALGTLPSMDEMLTTLDANNSSSSISTTHRQQPSLGYSYAPPSDSTYQQISFTFSLPMSHETLDYHRGTQVDTLMTRNTTFLTFRLGYNYYKWESGRQFYVDYGIETQAPSMTSLLNIRDDSNPLYITLGNPNLKNTRRHSLYANYQDHLGKTMLNAYLNAGVVENAVASGFIYNKETGVRTVMPDNVNGNWSVNVSSSADFPIDKNDKWRVKERLDYNHTNSVDLSGTNASMSATKSVVVSNYVTEDLTLTWRPSDKLELGAQGKLDYQHSGSDRENFTTINAFTYQYGVRGQVELPWNMQVATDLTMYSRRGYSEASMNTNELVWNARVSKRLPKQNLTILFDGFDLLGNLSNVRRYINAQARSETFYNVIPSYGLLHVIYRFNKEPKKKEGGK